MTELGSLNYCLDISVTRGRHEMFLSQQKYATKIVAREKMYKCKFSLTRAQATTKIDGTSPLVEDPTLYCSLAAALQYLTFACPDILHVVQKVYLYMNDPRELHFTTLKQILTTLLPNRMLIRLAAPLLGAPLRDLVLVRVPQSCKCDG